MANYTLAHLKGQSFYPDAPTEDAETNDMVQELLQEAAAYVALLPRESVAVNLNLSYDESFIPYLTVYYE